MITNFTFSNFNFHFIGKHLSRKTKLSVLHILMCSLLAANENKVIAQTSIGDDYGGGKVAYILESWDPGYVADQITGIIAAANDLDILAQWGCYNTELFGTSSAIGEGAANTEHIVATCSEDGIAALLCSELQLNDYDDWYLPSIEELGRIYLNRSLIGGFLSDNDELAQYWSSTESGASNGWLYNFNDGLMHGDANKPYETYVRPVRSFVYIPASIESNGKALESSMINMNTYPNPCSDLLNIEFTLTRDSQVKLEILSITGQQLAVLYSGHASSNKPIRTKYIPSSLNEGMVIYRISTEYGSRYGKTIILP